MRRQCSILGCERPHDSHDFCVKHAAAWRKYGDPLHVVCPRGPVEERFWFQVEKSEDGCWLWVGSIKRGRLEYRWHPTIRVNGRHMKTSQYAYTLMVGPIPTGLCVCHHCDNPRCVRPDHLFLGTRADNNADKTMKGRGWYPGPPRGDRNGSRTHPETQRGNRAPRRKLSEADIPIIRQRLANGDVQLRIAKDFGVTGSIISNINTGKIWIGY